MQIKKTSVILILLLLAAAVTFGVKRYRGENNGRIKVSGTLEVTSLDLSFKVAGRLLQRLVNEGDKLQGGQLVARLDDDELKQEHKGRAAEEKSLRAASADLEAGNRREEIAQGEAALSRMKSEADRIRKEAARAEALFMREVIAQKDLDLARSATVSADASLKEAELRLKLLKIGPRPDAVRQAKARIESAAASTALAETRMHQTVLSTPVSGVVLATHAEPGEMVMPGAPVITVGKMDEVWLRAYIAEPDLARISTGQSATVMFDGLPGRHFEGKVSYISSESEFTPKNIQTEKERVKLVYRIKITLPNRRGELKAGMPADAVIATTP